MLMKAGLLLVLLYLASGQYSAEPCYACSCVKQPLPQLTERAGHIFAGKVTEIRYRKDPRKNNAFDTVQVSFEVSRVWKGEAQADIKVYTNVAGQAACGYDFKYQEEYLVFTGADHEVSLCTGTLPLNLADSQIGELGQSQEVARPSGQGSHTSSPVDVFLDRENVLPTASTHAYINEQGQTMLPLEDDLLKKLGISAATFENNPHMLQLKRGKELTLQLGSNILVVDRKDILYLDSLVIRENGTVYVPLRNVLETLGFKVLWTEGHGVELLSPK